jgi:hypothetical protein
MSAGRNESGGFLCSGTSHFVLLFACREPGFQVTAREELEFPDLNRIGDETTLLPQEKSLSVNIEEINDMRDCPIFPVL